MLPRYRGVSPGTLVGSFPVSGRRFHPRDPFFEAPLNDGAPPSSSTVPELFDRRAPYGIGNSDYVDNARRFAMLVRAALEFAARRGRPSIVHAHDWQAGLAPVYSQTVYGTHPVLGGMPAF